MPLTIGIISIAVCPSFTNNLIIIMPSVDELAADDPYDVEAATRAAKKMTSNQLRDRLTAASADASGLKPALVEKWVATAREVAVAKKTKLVTGEDVARVSDALSEAAPPRRANQDPRL